MALSGLISIHDVMPETRERVTDILEQLAWLPPAAVTLLVVPGKGGPPIWTGCATLASAATRLPATAGGTAATPRKAFTTVCTARSFHGTRPSICRWTKSASSR